MKTEEELMAAFEAGTLSEEEQDRFLIGDSFESETVKTEADPLPAKADDEAGTVKAEPEQPVVLAKDGVHTIPFSIVEELRANLQSAKDESANLRQAFEDQKGLLEKLTAAQATDAKTGNDDAKVKILLALEEDYPGITEELRSTFIEPVRAELEPLRAELAPLKADRAATVQRTAEQQAAEDFDKSIADIESSYTEVVAKPDFWDWFNKQSPMVRAAQSSGDPAVVADVIKLYNAQQAPVSDKTKDVAEAVKAAMEKASAKTTVHTLSDIPGGTNPAADATEAFNRLPKSQQLDKMLSMDPSEINKLLDRIV